MMDCRRDGTMFRWWSGGRGGSAMVRGWDEDLLDGGGQK